MPEELTAKNKIEILSVLYGPYGCTALFVSGLTSSIGKEEREAMQKAIASVLDGDMDPRPNLRAPHITPNDADCKGCPERQNQGLVWGTESPTVPGWYWLDEDPKPPRPVEVVPFGPDGNMHIRGYTEMRLVDKIMGWWAGPIPIPEEAE